MGGPVSSMEVPPDWRKNRAVIVLVILGAAAAGAALHIGLIPFLQGRTTFVPALLAVLVAAWICGGRAGLLTAMLVGGAYHFNPLVPAENSIFAVPVDSVRLGLFAIMSLAICGVCTAMHGAQRREQQRLAEARRAQRDIEELHQRFEIALESGQVMAWDWDLDANQVVRSNGARSMYGLSSEPLDSFYELMHPDDRPGLEAAVKHAIATDTGYEHQFRVQFLDGSTRWLMGRARMRRNAETGSRHLTGSAVDISDRIRAEDAMRETQERFQAFMHHSPAAAYIKDDEGRYLFVNSVVEKLFDRSAQNILGKTDIELVPSAESASFRANDVTVLTTGQTTEFHETLGDKGRELTFLTYKFLLRGLQGKSLVGGMSLDISARVRAERDLKDSEARFQKMADSIPQLAWTARPDGVIDWFNRRWTDYTGIGVEQFSHNGWQLVVEPGQLSQVQQTWTEGLGQGGEIDLAFSLRGKDGAFRPFLMTVVPLTDAQGQVLQWFGTHTDIASQVALDAQRREEDQRKDAFLATLAHELRNPMAPLRNGLEVLKRMEPGDAGWTKTQAMMDRQLGHVSRLLDDLLDISRIKHGKLELNRQRMSLAKAIELAAEMVEAMVVNAGQSLVVEDVDPLLHVHGDLFRLAQVFANLLNNAAKFSPRGTTIRVSVRKIGFQAEISVEDHGVGITAEQLPLLFDLFWQAQGEVPNSRRGLGIGLSLVRSIVDLHGGTVSAESAGAGGGSVFRVRLPMALPTHFRPAEPSANPQPNEESGACVLIVDDNQDAAESLAQLLRLEGYRAVVAFDGAKALEAADLHQPAAAILDIGMPGMDGYETCRELRTRPFGGAMLIVALTGWGQPEDRRRSEEAGFNAHFVKPLQHEDLVGLLGAVTASPPRQPAPAATGGVTVVPTPIADMTINLVTDAGALAGGRLGDAGDSSAGPI